MELDDLKRRIIKSINNFLAEDAELLKQNAKEEAITTHLTKYLRDEFADWDWNIDHQYDKRIIENDVVQKRTMFARSSIPNSKLPKTIPAESEMIDKFILPDIIFHDRCSNEHNFLVIEVKLSMNKKKDDRDFDFLKLQVMTSIDLLYEWGLFLDFTSGREFNSETPFKMRFISNGIWEEER